MSRRAVAALRAQWAEEGTRMAVELASRRHPPVRHSTVRGVAAKTQALDAWLAETAGLYGVGEQRRPQ